MKPRYVIGFAGIVLLCTASLGVQAEIIKRVNPDGSNTYIVPQKVPSGASTGPCGVNADDILTSEAAQETYTTLLGTLRLDPNNVACRQALAAVGRLAGRSESIIANDLNALAAGGGGSPLPLPGPGEPAPNTGTAQ